MNENRQIDYDVFLSYRRNEAGAPLTRLIAEHLREKGLLVFFDEDTIKSGKFNEALYTSIERSSNFAIVLTKDCLNRCTNKEDWVRKEFEYALKMTESNNLNIIPIFTNEFVWPEDDSDLIKACPAIKTLKYYNGRKINYEDFNNCINSIVELFNKVESTKKKEKRIDNDYLNSDYSQKEDNYEQELERLHRQRKLLDKFDKKKYLEIFSTLDNPAVLDVGCSDCNSIMPRMGDLDNISLFVGLDSNEASLISARDEYNYPHFIYQSIDVTDGNALNKYLKEVLKANHKTGFDVINISMVLLHIKKPYELIKNLFQHLNDDGYMIIKDIDDGFNIAYPDPEGSFDRVFKICSRNETSGYRKCGREIYNTLIKFFEGKDISLDKLCVTTVGMNRSQRRDFFDIYFSFILSDLKYMVEKYPFDKYYREDYEWYQNIYNDLEQEFIREDFFFSLGFMLFVAKKQ